MDEVVVVGSIETPLGAFGAALSPRGLGRLIFPGEPLTTCVAWAQKHWPAAAIGRNAAALQQLSEQLSAYLAGERQQLTVPLDLRGTAFQLAVWQALLRIDYGQTRSYGQIAAGLGQPAASRAVGSANGANPVPLLVPCHRVIGGDGQLVGYGGGLGLKRRLLALEGIRLPSVVGAVQLPLFAPLGDDR